MTRILLLAPSSYPVQHAEAIVNIKLLQCLSNRGEFGIDLISEDIATNSGYPTAPLESYNINLESINIVKSQPIKNISDKIVTFLRGVFISGKIWKINKWGLSAYKIAKKLCRKNRYDYILTKDRDSFLTGLLLKKKFGIPVVATWNDPYPEFYYPFPYKKTESGTDRFFRKFHEKAILNDIDLHIFPSIRLRNYMADNIGLELSKTVVIPHVVLNHMSQTPTVSDGDKLSLIVAGNSKSPRNPMPLMQAAANVCKENPEVNLEIVFLGCVDDGLIDRYRESCKNLKVSGFGSVNYQESLEIVGKHDIAVVLEADCKEGIFLPTKVTDYMQIKKKILALSPKEGVLNDLYIDEVIDYFADVTSVKDIEIALIRCWKERNLEYTKSTPASFSERNVANKYKEIAELYN